MNPLERRYQRLLLAYPRAYRRARSEEIVGLLMDAAPPDRTRPTVREAVNLLRHGLRARLGRPASRSVMMWAALTAAICGLFSAAVATRLAWDTARPMPDRAETIALATQVAPEHTFTDVQVTPELFTFGGHKVRLKNLHLIAFSNRSEYSQASSSASATGEPPMPSPDAVARAEAHLREGGWHVYPKATEASMQARRGDTVLTFSVTDPLGEPGLPYLSVVLQRATPPAVLPAGILSGLLGAALAWLIFGWASRRTEGRILPNLCLALTLTLWWGPTAPSLWQMARHHLSETHPIPHPFWEWIIPGGLFIPVGGALSALLGIALAATRSSATAPATRQVE